jgi:phage FluMu protein Com
MAIQNEWVQDDVLSKCSAYYDRRCPRCDWNLPKGYHITVCPKCNLFLGNIKVKIKRERRCPYCNAVNSPKWYEERFCRKCLRNLDIVSGMDAAWFDRGGIRT